MDMVTGDLNEAEVEWVVQYRVTDPTQYLFSVQDPEDTLRAGSEAVMREVIGDRTIDEVITYGRQDIENENLVLLKALAQEYKLGISIDLVQLKNVNPPRTGPGGVQRRQQCPAGKTKGHQPGAGRIQHRGSQSPRPGRPDDLGVTRQCS